MKTPNFIIESDTHERIVLRDVGPWDEFPSITNGAEAVVEKLVAGGRLPPDLPDKRVLYYDSEGVLDELVVEKGRFARFAFGPVLTTIAIAVLIAFFSALRLATPSDWSACGIKPPPPVSCIHCEALCLCAADGKCTWVYQQRR